MVTVDERRVPDLLEVRPGDPQRVVTLLPGRGYTPQAPLLRFTSSLLVERGWTVREVWWSRLPPTGDPQTDARQALVEGERALRAVQVREHVVVAKSLGTRLLPVARELGLPGVWLTPLLREDTVRGALGATAVPSLLVGGSADSSAWDHEVAEQAAPTAGTSGRCQVPTTPWRSPGTPGRRCACSSRSWTGSRAFSLVRTELPW